MEIDELKDDRTIDPRQLDVEELKQIDLYFKWQERAINAKAAEEAADYNLEKTHAMLTLKAAESPEDFGLKKATVEAIKAAVVLHPDYEVAIRNKRKARKELALLNLAVSTMEIRSRTIGRLIDLHSRQYFAGPTVPRDLITIWEKSQGVGGKVERIKARKRGESTKGDE